MPKLSPTMEEGTIVKWHKKVGDFVKPGDILFEVATDKATVEHAAIDEGYLRKILIEEGKGAVVNQPVAIFTEKKDESIEGYSVEPPPAKEEVKPEKAVAKKEEKEKVAMPKAQGLSQPAFVPEPPLKSYEFEGVTEAPDYVPASPLAKKLAKQKGLDLSTVKGSGPHGRVMSKDLDLAQPDATVAFGKKEKPTTLPGTYDEIPMTPMRKKIAERMQEAKTFIPHFYVHQDVDVSLLVHTREQLSKFGIKATYNDFVVRACALALRDHPNINSGFDSVSKQIIRFKTIDIAIAVTLEGGLITPIIRHADYKNLGLISAEVKHLADLAKKAKLQPEQYRGGSFTVSNMGMFGVTSFLPIINPPQAAILGIGGIADRPVIKDGQVVPGKVMQISLSCDHRVIDGTEAAKFIKDVQKILENPSILLL